LDDLPLFEINYNITLPSFKFIKRSFDLIISTAVLFLIYPFIFFKSKLTNNKSDFLKFILNMPSVFSGRLSLVGPKINTSKVFVYAGKPGLTGLWFVEQTSDEETERQNIFYAKNQNIWLDLEI